MEKISVISKTKHYIKCPHCGMTEHRVDHLFGEGESRWGAWYCDECFGGFEGVVKNKEVFLKKVESTRQPSINFLRKDNILIAVKGTISNGKIDNDSNQYYYEEHTCPINYIRDAEMVINLDNGEIDPHGLFLYVGSIPFIDFEEADVESILSDLKINIGEKS